jgi:hypothetical protein
MITMFNTWPSATSAAGEYIINNINKQKMFCSLYLNDKIRFDISEALSLILLTSGNVEP